VAPEINRCRLVAGHLICRSSANLRAPGAVSIVAAGQLTARVCLASIRACCAPMAPANTTTWGDDSQPALTPAGDLGADHFSVTSDQRAIADLG
jgi:hypothetical protein